MSSLPPIHQLRLDVKLNVYGQTTKTQDNVFKKTLANIARKKDDHYMITGKRLKHEWSNFKFKQNDSINLDIKLVIL